MNSVATSLNELKATYWNASAACKIMVKIHDGTNGEGDGSYIDTSGDAGSSAHSRGEVAISSQRLGCDNQLASTNIFDACCYCASDDVCDAQAANVGGSEPVLNLALAVSLTASDIVTNTDGTVALSDELFASLASSVVQMMDGLGVTSDQMVIFFTVATEDRKRTRKEATTEVKSTVKFTDPSLFKVRCAFSDRNLHSRMPLDPRMFARSEHACDQWQSSRKFTTSYQLTL
jgi:hypothetical protein